MTDLDAVKAQQQKTWATGDFAMIGWNTVYPGELLCEAAELRAGQRVLDVAAGNGRLLLLIRGIGQLPCELDPSPAQIAQGRQRARKEDSSIAWVRGDGRRLPFADSSFDACLDSFGEEMHVVEMFRVVHPRGVVGIAQWTGEGFFGAYVELLRRSSRGPDRGEYRPELGQEDFVRTSLAPLAERIDVERRAIRATYATAESFCDDLLEQDPYVRPMRTAMASERWDGFADEMRGVVSAWNAADDGSVLLELWYRLTVATTTGT